MLTISGRSVGSRKPLFADWSIPLPPGVDGEGEGDGGITLRDVIERVVRAEVDAFKSRQEARRLDRVMTREQIERAAEKGKIDPAGKDFQQDVDPEEAVGVALQAFEDGLYLVIIDGVEHRDLDAQVFLSPDSRIVFVRLVFLAGW